MEQGHSSDANRSSRCQKILHIMFKPKVHPLSQKTPPHDPYPETDQSSTDSLYFLLKIHFNSIPLLHLYLPSVLFLSGFPTKAL